MTRWWSHACFAANAATFAFGTTAMMKMRCSVWLLVVACLLLTSSEAFSSGGLRRLEDGETREPTATPTLMPRDDNNHVVGSATDAPTAPAPDGDYVPATLALAPTLAPSVQQDDEVDSSTLMPTSVVPNDAGNGFPSAPTVYSPEGETFYPTEKEPTDQGETLAPTHTPTGITPAPSSLDDTIPASPAASPSQGPGDDDIYVEDQGGGDDTYNGYVEEPTDEPAPYVPLDDDPVKDEEGEVGGTSKWVQEGESPEDMMHDRNVIIAVSVIGGVALLLMIITAQQMMENPDGCCARYEPISVVCIIVCIE